MSFPKIKVLSEHNDSVFNEDLSKTKDFKRHFSESLEKDSSVQGVALGSGALIGNASLFSKDETNDFRLSG